MLKNIFKYDSKTYLLIENDILAPDQDGNYKVPDGWTDIEPPPGLYIAKFYPDEQKWKESADQDYIDALQPPSESEPDPIDLLKKQNAILTYEIAKLQKAVAELSGGSS
ncbi:hypothetical protein [Bacillus haynesii]|uniref:hypothetical protein n=1 Tax=Bacillus haynesii TaxID=1925021 RepID=UPI0005C6D9A1|nr:hypothetical protein [Bacillus haynesii]